MADDFRYQKISPKFWTDEKVLNWDDDTKLLALYLLTCPHRTMEGLFRLPKLYIAADLGWDTKRLAKPFQRLVDDGFISYDENVSVILLRKALKYQCPDNPNQEKSAIKKLEELPETPLLGEFIQLAELFAEGFAKRLVERFGKPQYSNSNSNSNSNIKTSCPNSADAPPDSSGDEREPYSEDSQPYQLALYLRNAILRTDPHTKVPDADLKSLHSWTVQADRMLRLDKRDPVEAKKLMDWSQRDTFWSRNILSMDTFRKHYDRLKRAAQEEARASPAKHRQSTRERTKAEWGWEV